MPEPVLQRADAPTLAMSTVHLDAARLRQLLVFERTLRSLAPAGCAPEQTARAHAAAVAASGAASSDVEAPLALLRRFAANRSLRARLADRVNRLEAHAPEDSATAEHRAELQRRMAELDDSLQTREEPATRRVLEAHAAEILALFAGSPPGV
jgi:small-conductance mechanosensitive channel